MRTSDLRFDPFQTVIRDWHGDERFFVITTFSSCGFQYWNNNGTAHWETRVFPYDIEMGGPDYGNECALLRCDSYEAAIFNHIRMVTKFYEDD